MLSGLWLDSLPLTGTEDDVEMWLDAAALFPAGILVITLTGIASAEAFGGARIQLYLLPGGIGTAEAFGIPALQYAQLVLAVAIGSGETFGPARIIGGRHELDVEVARHLTYRRPFWRP